MKDNRPIFHEFAPGALDAARVAAILENQFPQLGSVAVAWLGEGCDGVAFEAGGQWVFKFPKRDDVARQLAAEGKLLAALAPGSPLPLPAFTFHGEPSAAFPLRFVGYRKLDGVPGIQIAAGPLAEWASTIGRFLSWLHRFPVDAVRRLGVPHHDVAALLGEVGAEALDDFHLIERVVPKAPLEEWHGFFAAGPPSVEGSASVVVHGDLAAEHVLLDPETHEVVGVIDWTDAAIGDPALDFAGLLHWGGETFAGAALAAYERRVDAGTLARARFLAACRGVGDIAFGLGSGRTEYIDAGVRALELSLGGRGARE